MGSLTVKVNRDRSNQRYVSGDIFINAEGRDEDRILSDIEEYLIESVEGNCKITFSKGALREGISTVDVHLKPNENKTLFIELNTALLSVLRRPVAMTFFAFLLLVEVSPYGLQDYRFALYSLLFFVLLFQSRNYSPRFVIMEVGENFSTEAKGIVDQAPTKKIFNLKHWLLSLNWLTLLFILYLISCLFKLYVNVQNDRAETVSNRTPPFLKKNEVIPHESPVIRFNATITNEGCLSDEKTQFYSQDYSMNQKLFYIFNPFYEYPPKVGRENLVRYYMSVSFQSRLGAKPFSCAPIDTLSVNEKYKLQDPNFEIVIDPINDTSSQPLIIRKGQECHVKNVDVLWGGVGDIVPMQVSIDFYDCTNFTISGGTYNDSLKRIIGRDSLYYHPNALRSLEIGSNGLIQPIFPN